MTSGTPQIDVHLVERLVRTQFPQWAGLPVAPVEPGGWDNRTFHLGDRMTVRLPSAAGYVLQVQKEQRWLPWLGQQLPLPISMPLAQGEPGEEYPWPWSVYAWIDGQTATTDRIADLPAYAHDLADFLLALSRIDATGGPEPGAHNFNRGGPPAFYDAETRRAIAHLDGVIDAHAATSVWEAALATQWDRPAVWFHGDVSEGNLLVRDGRLSAVIDFGTCGVGDPACDLAITWTQFFGESREVFRANIGSDSGTWARGRGWTLWKALIVAAGVMGSEHPEIRKALRIIDDVIEDHRRFS
jgi:aminoglycoside phosphotransferase (APT) family kinase protein